MTGAEIELIESFRRGIAQFSLDTPYLEARMAERGISLEDIHYTVHHGRLVEINNVVWYDIRAALRHSLSEYDCTAVVSLSRRVVITAWKNRADDVHSSRTLHQKTWNPDIKRLLDTHRLCVVN
jgi:hypothetical protein